MKPVILVILDGFGLGPPEGNAIYMANTPCLDKIFKNNPFSVLSASGISVGLPRGQMGNSEVGHTNIGAGRVVYQELTRISEAIKGYSFFDNPQIKSVMEYSKISGGTLHICGLLSDGGVHSHISHLYALLKMAKRYGIEDLNIHVWLDGRDTPPKSSMIYINDCETRLKEFQNAKISTICGRYYSMDRDCRWDRISKAYDAMANAKGKIFDNAKDFIQQSYTSGVTDEFIVPGVRRGYSGISEKDALICFNFRPDRARQITRCFTEKIEQLQVDNMVIPKEYLCFTQYDESLKNVKIAFRPQVLANTFGECISTRGLKQLRIAETEKYAHVTFFFSGGREAPFPGEERILIPSPKVATYDLKPEMSAHEITDTVISKAKKGRYDAIILNYANCDMVGHTGSLTQTIKAVEVIDVCIKKLVAAFEKLGYAIIITADHGNAEKMLTSQSTPFTSHTTNPVPFCVINHKCHLKPEASISDIAPTLLQIMDVPTPRKMSSGILI